MCERGESPTQNNFWTFFMPKSKNIFFLQNSELEQSRSNIQKTIWVFSRIGGGVSALIWKYPDLF